MTKRAVGICMYVICTGKKNANRRGPRLLRDTPYISVDSISVRSVAGVLSIACTFASARALSSLGQPTAVAGPR